MINTTTNNIKILSLLTILVVTACSKPITWKANKLYDKMAYVQAIKKYNVALSKDSTDVEVLSKMANCHRLIGNSITAEKWYKKVVMMDGVPADDHIKLAEVLMNNGKYELAHESVQQYKELVPADKRASNYLESIEELEMYLKINSAYKISKLNINSPEDDFAPYPYKDGMIFASSRVNEFFVKYNHAWNERPFTKVYYAKGNGTVFNAPDLFEENIQTKYHDGAVSFNGEQNTIYFTRNNVISGKLIKSDKDIVKLKIFTARVKENTVGKAEPLPFNNDNYHCAHPSITTDGKTLYFASDMPGGYGGMDLYVVERTEDSWNTPKNLGPSINTEGNEIFPNINSDGVLYFASNGHKGIGGLDNYYSVEYSDDWMEPVNIGIPVNTKHDDFGLVFNNDNKTGYFCSDRPGGKGHDDIYAFARNELPLEVLVYDNKTKKPIESAVVVIDSDYEDLEEQNTDKSGRVRKNIQVNKNFLCSASKTGYTKNSATLKNSDYSYESIPLLKIPLERGANYSLSGLTLDLNDRSPIDGAVVTLNNVTDDTYKDFPVNKDGKYSFVLEPEKEYTVSAKKDECISLNNSISTKGIKDSHSFYVDIDIACVGDIIRLEDLYYDFDKYYIRSDAAVVLDRLHNTMRKYPKLKIEMRSHTDSRGSDGYNKTLSHNRAKSAVKYLIEKGIDKSRMKVNGYGELELTNKCSNGVLCNEQEHQSNRRTEIKILSIN